jgi:hypothetical protein
MPAPGVVVTTAVRSGPTGTVRAPSGTYFPIGITERGPVDAPQRVQSMAEYRRIFGDRTAFTTLYDDLAAFFESGGSQAYVLRVVGAAATVGTLSVPDPLAVPTIRVDAASAGAYSSRLTFQVVAGTNGAATRKAVVRFDGNVVEAYDNLATVAAFVAAFAASPWVRVTDLGSASADKLPAATFGGATGTALTAGNDDRATVNAARLTTQLALMKPGLGDGAVAAPTFGAAMHAALIAHAKDNRRVAILAAARTATVDDLIAASLPLGATVGAEFAGLFGPHLIVSDGAGGTRVIGPEGYVAAARNRAHEAAGPWQPAAGEGSVTPFILGVDKEFSKADHERLDAARVNPIRLVAGRNRLYGWRSLSSNETDYASLTVADTLNRLATECEARLEPSMFRTIDGRGQLLAELKGILIGVLEPIRAAGGIFERVDPVTNDVLDPGYSVDVSSSLNTAQTLARNELYAAVAARLSPNAALINLTIVKVGLTAAV